jgi:hypothetical protein
MTPWKAKKKQCAHTTWNKNMAPGLLHANNTQLDFLKVTVVQVREVGEGRGERGEGKEERGERGEKRRGRGDGRPTTKN